jgi:hypothetical protein
MYKLSLPKELPVAVVLLLKTSTKSNISKTWIIKYKAFLFQAMSSLPFLKGGSAVTKRKGNTFCSVHIPIAVHT